MSVEAASLTAGSPDLESPWAKWNLRCNPFGEPSSAEVASLIVADIEPLLLWTASPGHALQLLGGQGRGKTSRLRALQARLSWPYVYVGEAAASAALPSHGSLLLDEAQRLPWRHRRRLFRNIDRLALSSHEDLRRELSDSGWRVWTVEVGGLEPSRLEAILARRLEWARRGPGPVPRIEGSTCAELAQCHGDDLRAILDDLYDRFQGAVAVDTACERSTPENPPRRGWTHSTERRDSSSAEV